ncbi:hypothetical protein AMECASPLE_032636 [Ameca splendens]|uniref:Uncharacterized protein n=1 Tax=Ameca splendens TaxID=208324 RepID=A0ABV0XJK5_9TELE
MGANSWCNAAIPSQGHTGQPDALIGREPINPLPARNQTGAYCQTPIVGQTRDSKSEPGQKVEEMKYNNRKTQRQRNKSEDREKLPKDPHKDFTLTQNTCRTTSDGQNYRT